MVELQHASQALPALHWTFKVHGSGGSYESVAQALMGPLLMVVMAELHQHLPKVSLAEGDDLVEALGLDGEDEAFDEGVEVGAMRGKTDADHCSGGGVGCPTAGGGRGSPQGGTR